MNLDGVVVDLERVPETDIGLELDDWVRDLPAMQTVSTHLAPRFDDPSTVVGTPTVFDAGAVAVEAEAVEASHEFQIHNDSAKTWTVKNIVKSCGVAACDLNTHSIAPGSTAVLSLTMTVPSPGERRQEVAVVFDDDRVQRFELRARGVSPGRLRVVSSGFTLRDGEWRADVRAYWTESDTAILDGVIEPLTVQGAQGATLTFDAWTVIEPTSADGLRPRKLFARGVVTLHPRDASGALTNIVPANLQGTLRFATVPSRTFELPIVTFDLVE